MTTTDLRARLLTRRRKAVPVAGDPDGTHVRALTIAEALRLRELVQAAAEGEQDAVASAWLIVLCACTEDGERILSDEDLGDVREWEADLAGPIADAASRVNRLDEKAKAAAKKNS